MPPRAPRQMNDPDQTRTPTSEDFREAMRLQTHPPDWANAFAFRRAIKAVLGRWPASVLREHQIAASLLSYVFGFHRPPPHDSPRAVALHTYAWWMRARHIVRVVLAAAVGGLLGAVMVWAIWRCSATS
jgi:hypothetical protein